MPATHSNATATKKASSPTRAPRKPPRRTRTTAPDALALLKDDHKRVDALFQRFAKLKEDGEQKAALVENICGELTIHTTLEEDVFYPAVRGAIGDDDLMDEAAVQHESARTLISEIMRMSPGDVYYDAKVAVLGEYIRHHVKEEQEQMFRKVRAANVDLKAFTDEFYFKLTGAHLQPVLDTLVYLKRETEVWFEITTLLIPGLNDSDREIDEMTTWVVDRLGPDVPMHFTAFHPDYKMRDIPPTPPATLTRARSMARTNGVRYAYTGNVHDESGGSTFCHVCSQLLIGRDWYRLTRWNLTDDGRCRHCNTQCAGVFDGPAGTWGRRRKPVRLAAHA